MISTKLLNAISLPNFDIPIIEKYVVLLIAIIKIMREL